MEIILNWLEIIKLRAAGNSPDLLEKITSSGSAPDQNGLVKIKYYRHAFLDTDLSLLLEWHTEELEKQGSALGLQLAKALKDFGLIDHSIWIEKKE